MNDQIPVSDYPYEIFSKGEIEKTDIKCPECGSNLERWFEADGPDDSREVMACPKCGFRLEE